MRRLGGDEFNKSDKNLQRIPTFLQRKSASNDFNSLNSNSINYIVENFTNGEFISVGEAYQMQYTYWKEMFPELFKNVYQQISAAARLGYAKVMLRFSLLSASQQKYPFPKGKFTKEVSKATKSHLAEYNLLCTKALPFLIADLGKNGFNVARRVYHYENFISTLGKTNIKEITPNKFLSDSEPPRNVEVYTISW